MKPILRFTAIILFLSLVSGCRTGQEKLFNGESMEGWECKPAELASHWKVEEGKILYGENPDEKGSILWTTDEYMDYDLELEYQALSDDYDSGVFPRGEGTQVQIGISRSLQRDMTACIYAPKDEMGAYPAQTDKVEEFHRAGEWNQLRIIVTGQRIRTFLNGEPFVDYESVTMNEMGPIGLQLHPNVHMAIRFRNIRIKNID